MAFKGGDGDMPTGTWLEETAAPYYVFTGAGHTVEIVSIAGGEIPVDEVPCPKLRALPSDLSTRDAVVL